MDEKEAKEWLEWDYKSKKYLHQKTLHFQSYTNGFSDHDHCELCWGRFSDAEDDLHEGYYEPDSKSWICEECFERCKERFRWSVGG